MSPLRERGYQSPESHGNWPPPFLGAPRQRGEDRLRGTAARWSWQEWPCEKDHLANACKSAPRLESSKVLSYYLSGGSILVSSGPSLENRQLQ